MHQQLNNARQYSMIYSSKRCKPNSSQQILKQDINKCAREGFGLGSIAFSMIISPLGCFVKEIRSSFTSFAQNSETWSYSSFISLQTLCLKRNVPPAITIVTYDTWNYITKYIISNFLIFLISSEQRVPIELLIHNIVRYNHLIFSNFSYFPYISSKQQSTIIIL